MMDFLPWPIEQGTGWIALWPVLVITFVVTGLGRAMRIVVGDAGRFGELVARVRRLGRLPELAEELALDASAGFVGLFAILLLLDVCSIPWRRIPLLIAVVLVIAGLAWVASRRPRPMGHAAPGPAPLGWGDGLAVAALAVLTVAVLSGWITIPDFVYHWGVKGRRYWLEGGIDFAYLSDPLRLANHPDYPNLLPSLYAVTAELLGAFDPRPMVAWTVVFAAIAVLAGRTALRRCAVHDGSVQVGLAVTALTTVFFAIGHDMAGGADVLIALSLLLALPALLGEARGSSNDRADDWRLGVAAGLAVAAKIEGVPLAAFFVATRLLVVGVRSPAHRFGEVARRLPRLALPSLLVGLPWLVSCLGLGLFSPANTGTWDTGRIVVILRETMTVMRLRAWNGLPWLLCALPALLLVRRLRVATLVLHLQAGFYLFVYLTAPVDTGLYVVWSLPRLLYHLMLPALVLLVLAADGLGRAPSGTAVEIAPVRPARVVPTS